MATQDDVDALHRAANIPANDTEYPDTFLAILIDQQGSVSAAAAAVWRYKAAAMATMVDTTESGSSRKLSDLHKNALEMAAGFDRVDVISRTGRSFTVGVERQ
jgi:phage portal protein BeeE